MRQPIAIALATLISACSGLTPAPDDVRSPEEACRDAAFAALGHAARRSDEAAELAVQPLVQRRISDANGLTDAIVTVLRAVRRAVPSTRQIDDGAMSAAHEALVVADRYFDARESDPFWHASPARDVVVAAAGVLDAVDVFVDLCDERRCVDADVAYTDVFTRYDTYREAASVLSAAGSRDPLGTWGHTGSPAEVADAELAARLNRVLAQLGGSRGRELRAEARAVRFDTADECLGGLATLSLEGAVAAVCARIGAADAVDAATAAR